MWPRPPCKPLHLRGARKHGNASGEIRPLPHGLAELHRYTPADALRPHIDRAEMLRYLGYNGQELEVGLAARIERVAAELERTVTPRGIWQVFPVDAQGDQRGGRALHPACRHNR